MQPLRRLTHLRVVFYSSIHNPGFSPAGGAHGEEYLRALRGPAFELAKETAASLVRQLQSLHYVLLMAAGYLVPNGRSKVCERWHAARAGALRSLRPIR